MKKALYLLACLVLFAGCGGKPVPEWTKTSHNQLDSFKKQYLQGRDQLAESSFSDAIAAVKSSGDLHLLQIAYLTRYAVQSSVLEDFDDLDYLRLAAVEPHAGNVHFHAFLKGAFDRMDEGSLPRQYRSFLRACKNGNQAEIDNAIEAIEDPLSRLIASGLAVQKQLYHEKTLIAAIQTASGQGWKKALLVYLKRLRDFYREAGHHNKAAATQQRINLIQ
jgi:hypothetical protein